ncbi:MAG: hypothetical protein V3W34_06220, partial [Phycisphaerae bacterium]
GNVLSGNGGSGVFAEYVTNTVIQGNIIGLDAIGTTPIPNVFHGVELKDHCTDNQIGGTTSGEENLIAHNGGNGVLLQEEGTDRNVVRGNLIWGNGEEILALWHCANGGRIPTTIESTSPLGVTGTVDAPDGSVVDVYHGQSDEPETYLGSSTVSGGMYNFSGAVPAGGTVCVAATTPEGNTSEFVCDVIASPPTMTPHRGDLIVSDVGGEYLLLIDPATGNRSILVGVEVGEGLRPYRPAGLGLRSINRILVGDPLSTVSYQASPWTGNREIVGGCPVGNSMRPTGVLLTQDRSQLLVADWFQDAIIMVDLETGLDQIISGPGVGSGPNFGSPLFMAWRDEGRIYVTGGSALLSVDVATGNREIVSGQGVGSGQSFSNPTGIVVEDENSVLVLNRGNSPALLRVDVVNGDRTTLLEGFGDPVGMSYDLDHESVFVVDQGARSIFKFDPIDLTVELVSSGFTGTGDPLLTPVDVVVWPFSFGDHDNDGDWDFADFAGLQRCFSGDCAPDCTMAVSPECETFDFDRDGDVGLTDYQQFEAQVVGAQG